MELIDVITTSEKPWIAWKTRACGVVCLIAALGASASGAGIRGVVQDADGKPLRGARVTVSSSREAVSRFADGQGRYQIDNLEPGSYEVTASAWGFEQKSRASEVFADMELDFALAPHWDVHRLSTADWLSALPENDETLTLRATCIRCHNLSYVIRRRGLQAPQWTNLVRYMGQFGDVLEGRELGVEGGTSMFRTSPEVASQVGAILAKYFGPDSAVPAREQVRRPAISDAALNATFREYKAPTRAYIHSVIPDRDGRYVWFSYFGLTSAAKKVGRFEIATGEFREVELPAAGSTSTLQLSKSGRVWVTVGGKLFEIDARTTEFTEHAPPASIKIGRTMEQGEDSQGNIWLAGDTVVKFDPSSGRFEEFGVPRVPDPGEGHRFNLGNLVEDGQKDFGSWVYALAVDSKDNVWYTHYDVGHIARIDPRTRQTRTYRIPDAIKIKGIDVAPDGTVWFGNFVRGTLGKLDPDTGRIEQYQPPTRFAEYYTAVVADDGKIWLSDFSGGQMTRFDPATKQFTEYPLPAPDGMVRFFGLDPKGHVWYVDFDTGIIGVLDPGDRTTL